jgi:hypothetical protein
LYINNAGLVYAQYMSSFSHYLLTIRLDEHITFQKVIYPSNYSLFFLWGWEKCPLVVPCQIKWACEHNRSPWQQINGESLKMCEYKEIKFYVASIGYAEKQQSCCIGANYLQWLIYPTFWFAMKVGSTYIHNIIFWRL